MKKSSLWTGLVAVLLSSAVHAAKPTEITITDRVKVADIERLGVHFGGDTFYDSVILKRRVAENFEGTISRLHLMGANVQPEPGGFYASGFAGELQDSDVFIGADAHILSGPDQGKVAKVVAIEKRPQVEPNKKGDTTFVKLDRSVTWSSDWLNGLLLVADTEGRGQHPWLVEKKENKVRVLAVDPQYASIGTVEVVTGDTPPDVGQKAALLLNGASGDAWIRFRVQFEKAATFQGDWTVKLWAKGRVGNPEFEVSPTVPGTKETLKLGKEWKPYTVKLKLNPVPAGENPIFMLQLKATGGEVLVDCVEAWKDGDGTNLTVFRDSLVNSLQELAPGSMRYLRNTRDSYINSVLPAIENQSQRGVGSRKDNFGTHEFYQLCAYLGANPWATLPGTILPEEIDQMMEYHGAPADKGLGKLRARLGQEKPWTEVFDKIHIQFGNEAITFWGTGYFGPAYWESLVKRAKASPYYDPNKFVFHLNEQGGGLARLFTYHPDFDRGTINGYQIFGLYQDQIKRAGDLPGFYDWVFASAWQMWMDPANNKNWNNLVAMRDRGKEISIYEGGNYHTTFTDPNDAPMEQINRLVVGRAGSVSALNSMLILLKNWGARTQQSFSLSQENFAPGGGFGNLPGRVRLWGGIVGMGSEKQRFRPRFLALAAANKVMCGDLMETVYSSDDPTFSVTSRFGAAYGPSRNPVEMTVSGVPRIHSYAFAEGTRRGLILISNDPREPRSVQLNFDGIVKDGKATVWWVESKNLEDSNELDWSPDAPKVTLETKTIDCKSGMVLDVPPATILSLRWSVE